MKMWGPFCHQQAGNSILDLSSQSPRFLFPNQSHCIGRNFMIITKRQYIKKEGIHITLFAT